MHWIVDHFSSYLERKISQRLRVIPRILTAACGTSATKLWVINSQAFRMKTMREKKKALKSTQLCTSSYLQSDKNNLWLFCSLQKAFSLLEISCSWHQINYFSFFFSIFQISWIRKSIRRNSIFISLSLTFKLPHYSRGQGHRDLHLLTVGKETYTPDQRFQSVHNPHTNDWSLKILYPQQKDSGEVDKFVHDEGFWGWLFLYRVLLHKERSMKKKVTIFLRSINFQNLNIIIKMKPWNFITAKKILA